MKLFISSLLFFLLVWSYTKGQNAKLGGVVTYSYRQDGLKLRRDYVLKFNSNSSVYIHRQEERSFTTSDGIHVNTLRDFSDWYIDLMNKEVTKRVILKDGTSLFAVYNAEPIKWELQNETKTILGHVVQKAIAKTHPIRTRETQYDCGDAIAWFATDIPVSSGPDEYWGLPGLILELRFSIAFYFIAEKIVFEPQKDFRPNQGIKVTLNQLDDPGKIDKKWLKNVRELLNKN
jgi:GLPGLI family protein